MAMGVEVSIALVLALVPLDKFPIVFYIFFSVE